MVLVLGSSLAAQWGISAAKRRLTYPRTGYVRYPPSGWPRRALSAALGLAAAVLLVIAWRAVPEALLPETLLEGAAIATFLTYLGAVSGTPRFFALAAISLAAGALAAWALGDALAGSALVFGVLALALGPPQRQVLECPHRLRDRRLHRQALHRRRPDESHRIRPLLDVARVLRCRDRTPV